MATLSLHDVVVPVFIRQLQNARHVLQQGEKWCAANGHAHDKLLEARLHPEMKPLPYQIRMACKLADSVSALVQGCQAVQLTAAEETEISLPQLSELIDEKLAQLEKIDAASFLSADTPISMKMGPHVMDFQQVLFFVQRFAIPNMFFHVVTAYDILRHVGVPLARRDYINFATLTRQAC